MTKDVTRLFTQFQPKKYALNIIVDPDSMTFSGTVAMDGYRSGRRSKRLTFHQNGLTITGARVTKHDKSGDAAVIIDR
ncbi:MAG TPA: hypothetical protein VM124_02950, partial [Candidatus Limnocylindrales bacterium]|nr:hypothetical protein [Candidatus Limnocylindrales bacterium]